MICTADGVYIHKDYGDKDEGQDAWLEAAEHAFGPGALIHIVNLDGKLTIDVWREDALGDSVPLATLSAPWVDFV